MAEIRFKLIRTPDVPVFAETLTADLLAGKTAEEILKLKLLEGNRPFEAAELFDVKLVGEPSEAEKTNITIYGDLSKFRYVGKGMSAGSLTIEGDGGLYVGQEMKGGTIKVKGDVARWAGSMMKGGLLEILGSAGDFLAAPYRGLRKGMLDGIISVQGNVGTEAGRHMLGGLISIDGEAGQFLGCNMQDGTIRVGGNCAGRVGPGMKGGRIIILGKINELLPTFTYSEVREKVKFGTEKISGSFYVYTGDLLENGNGKIFLARVSNLHLNPECEVFPGNISVNRLALPIVEKMIKESGRLNVEVIRHSLGATIVDAGVKAKGSEDAGILTALICVAGLSEYTIETEKYGDIEIKTLSQTTTGHPATATMASQFAGWAIRTDDYFALGSGPARALSLQPKKLFNKLAYSDKADVAVLVLETDILPTDSAVKLVAESCKVNPKNLYIVAASTSSIVGSIQTAGRIVETGIHKLTELGFTPNKILLGKGKVPISPVHPKSEVAMGMVNDMILYGGDVYYEATCKTDDEIADIIDEAPSTASRDYGKPFYEIFLSVGKDFYKVDPGLFAPAKITIRNVKTGNSFTAGKINPETLKQSLNLLKTA